MSPGYRLLRGVLDAGWPSRLLRLPAGGLVLLLLLHVIGGAYSCKLITTIGCHMTHATKRLSQW